MAARGGDQEALGRLLQQHRQLLSDQCAHEINAALRGRIDASDVVQKTCLSAVLHFNDFDGENADEFEAWLRKVNRRNLLDEIRKHTQAGKRRADREVSIGDEGVSKSQLIAEQSTASKAIVRRETASELENAIQQLTSEQADVVWMKHIDGMTLREIASETGKSEEAIAGLLRRGLGKLRQILGECDSPE